MGFFSWLTQDTHRSIANRYSPRSTFTVYMVDPRDGKQYREDDYEGYGVFGGKDYYELLAELNGKKTRDEGLAIEFNKEGLAFQTPLLLEFPGKWQNYTSLHPKSCRYQGYFYPEEKESMERIESFTEDEECAGCGNLIRRYEPAYFHTNRYGEGEWLCPDCAAILMGETLDSKGDFEFRR